MKPFLALPSRNYISQMAGAGALHWATKGPGDWRACISSLLTQGFNTLWCEALNAREDGVTDFAMLHDDILPEQGWLDILHEERQRAGADCISVVVPMKNDTGITSTALEMGNFWKPKRLTLHEAHNYPKTFTQEDTDAPLLLNTGCWLVKLGDWSERVCFDFKNKIESKSGKWRAGVISEDWDFSRQLNDWGVKLAATTAVKVAHCGDKHYVNDKVYGYKQDPKFTLISEPTPT